MNNVVIHNMPDLPYAMEEALNRLRVNISFLGNDIKKILVVSTTPDEGKSFVSMQLWRMMAEAEEKSILVDADLRKSVMMDKYEIHLEDGSKPKGTSSYLSSDDKLGEVIVHTQYEYGDLMVNKNNVVNPSLLLEGKRFEEMLQAMAKYYRYVFVDAPPLGMVADGERIASFCDGAILVVRGGITSKHLVKRSIQQLERAGCPLLGIVLNRVEGTKGGYYYKKYGSKYYGKKYNMEEYYGSK